MITSWNALACGDRSADRNTEFDIMVLVPSENITACMFGSVAIRVKAGSTSANVERLS